MTDNDAAFAEDVRRVAAICSPAYRPRETYTIDWLANGLPAYPCDLYNPPQRMVDAALR